MNLTYYCILNNFLTLTFLYSYWLSRKSDSRLYLVKFYNTNIFFIFYKSTFNLYVVNWFNSCLEIAGILKVTTRYVSLAAHNDLTYVLSLFRDLVLIMLLKNFGSFTITKWHFAKYLRNFCRYPDTESMYNFYCKL